MALLLATDKQAAFITRLMAERPDYPRIEDVTFRLQRGMARQNASAIITELLAFPKPEPPKPAGPAAIAPIPNILQGDVPAIGTFTVVTATGHQTLKFRKARMGNFAGKVIVKARVGAEYDGIAHAENGAVRVWRKALTNGKALEALRFLLQSKSAQLAAGKAYALESGHCWRCNKELTDPISIERGIGPDCLQMIG